MGRTSTSLTGSPTLDRALFSMDLLCEWPSFMQARFNSLAVTRSVKDNARDKELKVFYGLP